MSWKRSVLVSGSLLLLGVFTGCSVQSSGEVTGEKKEIHIGFPSSGGSWPGGVAGVAEEEGFFEEYLEELGYTVVLDGFTGAAPAIHEALVSEDLDMTIYAGMAGVLAKATGIDTTVVAISGYSSSWQLVTIEGTAISSVEELIGKKVAYTRGTAVHEYLINVLEDAGLSMDDIEAINMTTPESVSSLVTGSVDAAVVSIGQELNIEQSVILHSEREVEDEKYLTPNVITVRTKFLEEHEEAVIKVLEALLDAKDVILEDMDGYYNLYAEKTGQSLEVVEATLMGDHLEQVYLLDIDDHAKQSLSETQSFLLSNELIANEVDFTAWFDRSYIDTARERRDANEEN